MSNDLDLEEGLPDEPPSEAWVYGRPLKGPLATQKINRQKRKRPKVIDAPEVTDE